MAKKYIAERDLTVNGKLIKAGKEVRGVRRQNLIALINCRRIKVIDSEEEKAKAVS